MPRFCFTLTFLSVTVLQTLHYQNLKVYKESKFAVKSTLLTKIMKGNHITEWSCITNCCILAIPKVLN